MSKVDWSLAPEGATHKETSCPGGFWYKFDFGSNQACFWSGKGWTSPISADAYNDGSMDTMEPRPAKQWSGPQDGLPPVGVECETRYHAEGFSTWHKGICVAVGESPEGDKICVVQSGETIAIYRTGEHLRATITPEQKRETAIREIMDAAGIDCRVTAARLVDAGFKREVV